MKYKPKKKNQYYPYRSKFEWRVAQRLHQLKTKHKYESIKIPFLQPAKDRTYTPDFILGNYIIIEAKGNLTVQNRQMHLWIKDQYPRLDIRFVFQNPEVRIRKKSETRFRDWADKNGFKWARGFVPVSWTRERDSWYNKGFIERLKKKVAL